MIILIQHQRQSTPSSQGSKCHPCSSAQTAIARLHPAVHVTMNVSILSLALPHKLTTRNEDGPSAKAQSSASKSDSSWPSRQTPTPTPPGVKSTYCGLQEDLGPDLDITELYDLRQRHKDLPIVFASRRKRGSSWPGGSLLSQRAA